MLACKKSESIPDNIIYTNLSPTIKLNTVNSFKYVDYNICSVNYPSPSDSSTFFDIDIDSDLQNDFRFVVRHFNWTTAYTTTYCGHCTIFAYDILIFGLNPNDSISINTLIAGPKCYDSASIISTLAIWRDFDVLYSQGGCAAVNFAFNDSYIGVKHQNKLGWIHIAPFGYNGIEIKEYAINETENKSIKAGQKK